MPTHGESGLRDYLRVLARHRAIIFASLAVSMGVAAVWLAVADPVYTATVTLRIAKEEPRVLKFDDVRPDGYDDFHTQLQTHYNLLRSRKLARRVIGALELERRPDFARSEADGWWRRLRAWVEAHQPEWWSANGGDGSTPSEDGIPESPVTLAFQRRLAVEPVRNARLLKVSFDSSDPALAARVANTLAETFILQGLEEKGDASRYAGDFLTGQLAEARRHLEASEVRLNQFLAAHDIIFVGGDSAGHRQDLMTQQLTVLSDALLKARSERIGKESLITQALQQNLDAVPVVLQSPLIAKLKEELIGLEGESRKLSLQFRPEYPRLQRLTENIAEVRRQVQGEMGRLVSGLESDFRAALRNEQELQKSVDQHRGLARKLGDQLARYNSLRREVDTSRELFASLLTRLKETQISSSLLTSNIVLTDPAEIPATPTRPRRGMILAVAAAIGLLGGVALAFVADYFDTTIKDVRELQATVSVRTLGFVPSQAALEGRRPGRNGDGEHFALVAHSHSRSMVVECFRKLRTSLLYAPSDRPLRSILVTSLHSEDGKSSLASNLAITMAQLGNGRVLLVDGDLRRPDLHTIFRASSAPGLSDILLGDRDALGVVRATEIEGLALIPAGAPALSPAELLGSQRFEQVLEELAHDFRRVLIDGPPLFDVSDAMILAPRVDGVVLVLRHGRATREAAQEAVHLLRSVRANLLGVVLNDVDGRAAGPGYGTSGYYSYSSDPRTAA
jgi:capsular exopolysaccharide synthesis family protein